MPLARFHMGVIPEDQFDALWSEDGYIVIVIAPPEKLSTMPGSKDERSSNRLCFLSEKQNLLGNTDEAIESLKKAILAYSAPTSSLTMAYSEAPLSGIPFVSKSLKLVM